VKEKKVIIRKHNQLINARYSFSISESRLILKVLSLINKEDEELKTYQISIKDFDDVSKHKGLSQYERIKKIIDDLQSKQIHIPFEDGFFQAVWISSAFYFEDKGYIDVELSERLKPYLLQLKEQFTWYEIENILALKGSYSFRIYELLKQYQKIGKREFKIEELKTLLEIEDKYKLYNDFRRRVILSAQKELKQYTDICFEFKLIKKGKKVDRIVFFIYPNIKQEKKEKEKNISFLTIDQAEELTNLFNNKSLNGFLIKEDVFNLSKQHKADYEKIKDIITKMQFKASYNSIATLINSLKGAYVISKENERQTEHERIRKEDQKKMELEDESKRIEKEKKDAMFNSLTETQRTQYMSIAKRQLDEEYAHLDETMKTTMVNDLRILFRAKDLAKEKLLNSNKITV
jgi:plasmid replication initiation protein